MQAKTEKEIIDETAKIEAAGGDPFGDDDQDPVEEGEDPLETDAAPEVAEGAEGEQVAAGEQERAPAASLPVYQSAPPEDYQAKRMELMKEKAAAMTRLMEGDLDAVGFAEIEARVSGTLEDLTAQRIRAETLVEVNTQNAQASQQLEIQRLVARTKSDIDYLSDKKAQKNFDLVLSTLMSNGDNAGRDFAEIISDAHKVVLALNGVQSKAASVATAILDKAASRKPQGSAPVTLRGLPVAATANSGGDAVERLGRLSGQAYEEAFKNLSPQQRSRLIDEE